jgi:hypothetical protein
LADFAGAAIDFSTKVTAKDDIALVAGQLATLTRTVAEMETRIRTLYERAENQQARADQQRERTEIQQERIDLAARELAEVSARLQAAADAPSVHLNPSFRRSLPVAVGRLAEVPSGARRRRGFVRCRLGCRHAKTPAMAAGLGDHR